MDERRLRAGDDPRRVGHRLPSAVRTAGGRRVLPGIQGAFAQILTSSRLVAAFGDDHTAVLFYDTDTKPVNDAPGAECLTVTDGKVSHMRIIFDRLPFEAARREVASG